MNQQIDVLTTTLLQSGVLEFSESDDLQVISITTGTKCLEGDGLSAEGLVVNDSHAEVLARRCVKRYVIPLSNISSLMCLKL